MKLEKIKTWEEKNFDKFNSLDFQEDILPILRECAKVALNDKEYDIKFTPLVIKNLNIITNKIPMQITYQQWKSFMTYYNENCRTDIKIMNLDKLGL